MIIARLHDRLIRTGQSRTRARDAVFMAVSRLGPCTRREVTQALTTQFDQTTVYRAMMLFERLGIISEVRPGRYELTDAFKQHHHHFVCRACGREVSFNDISLEKVLTRIAAGHRLTLEQHSVELTGLCSLCTVQTSKGPEQLSR